MEIKNKFIIPKNIAEARSIQVDLRSKIIMRSDFEDAFQVKTVAGCDVSYSRDEKKITAAVVVMKAKTMEPIEKVKIKYKGKFKFPYVPGYLSFREGPVLIEAIEKLKTVPDLFLFDGQGIAHPRGMGIATHMGIILDKPSIGCAKSLLYGNFEEPPPGLKGAYTFLKDDAGTMIGIAMRSKVYTKPIFISQGNRIGLVVSADIVANCLSKYRIPEPIRLAHIEANK